VLSNQNRHFAFKLVRILGTNVLTVDQKKTLKVIAILSAMLALATLEPYF
jgi:hypothetical protein